MNLKDRAWKIATAAIVVLIALNPEMIELAIFIDAIGLDLFLMLIEIQVVTIFGALLDRAIKPALITIKNRIKRLLSISPVRRVKTDAQHLILSSPGEVILMHMLVISSLTGCAIMLLF